MNRARSLRNETAINSISPERAGGIMYDTLAYINEMQLQDANPLLLSKIYDSVAEMEADPAPVSDLDGSALLPGQLVCIVTGDPDDPEDGLVYRYDGTEDETSSWTAVGRIGSAPYLDGFLYMGKAVLTPTPTDPGAPTQKVFYEASEPGTYGNFGNLVVNEGEVVYFKFDGDAWSKDVTGAATKAQLDRLKASVGAQRIYQALHYDKLETYATRIAARAAVTDKYQGCRLIYLLTDGTLVEEQYVGSGPSNWPNDAFWEPKDYKSVFVSPPSNRADKYIRHIYCNETGRTIAMNFAITATTEDNALSLSLVCRIYDGNGVQTNFLNGASLDSYASNNAAEISIPRLVAGSPEITLVVDVKAMFDAEVVTFSVGGSSAVVNYELGKGLNDAIDINEGALYPFVNVTTSPNFSAARADHVRNYLKAVLDVEIYGANEAEGYVYQIYLLSKRRSANDWGNGVWLKKLSATDYSLVESMQFKSPSAPLAVKAELDKIEAGTPAWMELTAFGKLFRILVNGTYLTADFAGQWGDANYLGASHYISPKCYRPAIASIAGQSTYKTLRAAVEAQHVGQMAIGQNVVIGFNAVQYDAADIRPVLANYKTTAPNPRFPQVVKSTLTRLYDSASNMLYVISHSAKRIYYSICPTDTKHIDYTDVDQFAVPYFYFAPKETPTQMVKVVLPSDLPGATAGRTGRKKYVFEMSNGDLLVEVENGFKYTTTKYSCNLYKITGVFDIPPVDGVITVPAQNISLVLSFEHNNSRISAFEQICEAKAGELFVAPYGSGITAIIYHSVDYGANWEVIFCGDTANSTIQIAPKYEEEGEYYGAWPTPTSIISSTPLDWSGTGNGNIHIHGIAYDRWMGRLWVCTGDGAGYPDGVTGIWWTDDIGRTWHRLSTRNTSAMDGLATQLMFPIPMEHSVIFATDGMGDGFWRWARTTSAADIEIEPSYNYLGERTNLVMVAGRYTFGHGHAIASFSPDSESQGDWMHRGGIVVTPNGFDYVKLYEDEFTEIGEITPGMTDEQKQAVYDHAFDTAEIGWSCDVIDCGEFLILKADKGGIIRLDLENLK